MEWRGTGEGQGHHQIWHTEKSIGKEMQPARVLALSSSVALVLVHGRNGCGAWL